MAVAVQAEGFADIGFFLRDVVFYFYRFSLRQETGKHTHIQSPFVLVYLNIVSVFIVKVFRDKSNTRLSAAGCARKGIFTGGRGSEQWGGSLP